MDLLVKQLFDGGLSRLDAASDDLVDLCPHLDLTLGVNAAMAQFSEDLAVASTALVLFYEE